MGRIEFGHVAGRGCKRETRGTARIDPETGAVRKMTARSDAPLSGQILKSWEMEMSHHPREFPSVGRYPWRPSTAAIDIQTERQHWRNIRQ